MALSHSDSVPYRLLHRSLHVGRIPHDGIQAQFLRMGGTVHSWHHRSKKRLHYTQAMGIAYLCHLICRVVLLHDRQAINTTH